MDSCFSMFFGIFNFGSSCFVCVCIHVKVVESGGAGCLIQIRFIMISYSWLQPAAVSKQTEEASDDWQMCLEINSWCQVASSAQLSNASYK